MTSHLCILTSFLRFLSKTGKCFRRVSRNFGWYMYYNFNMTTRRGEKSVLSAFPIREYIQNVFAIPLSAPGSPLIPFQYFTVIAPWQKATIELRPFFVSYTLHGLNG